VSTNTRGLEGSICRSSSVESLKTGEALAGSTGTRMVIPAIRIPDQTTTAAKPTSQM
jgi:hypothetical protein